ncbi:hypothetical protein GTY75_08735 [Streptomyces sp. SID8381]|uniref:hypothetical protein n=1 Tax=unclassified Streptomyces TaxID=2593676 RepID=UPI000372B47A|nr:MULTISPECIES: hypothetical protein [unclassified Streptomyces]MYX26754.1 hypothetical protein [Streptomyces sp. SID8381]
MTTYDYRPVWAGAVCDPATAGGSVDRIDLYDSPDRTGSPIATSGPAERIREAVYRFTLPDSLADGRYWCVVTFRPSPTLTATDRTVRVDLPRGTGLIASAEQVADELGVTLPLTAAQRERYWTKIRAAQADVSSYLGRPLVPTPRQLLNVTPLWGYALNDPQAWPIHHFDDVVTVLGHVDNLDGTFSVNLLVGLDAAAEEPIVRYVVAHAAEAIRNDPAAPESGTRRVTSVSAEGQSISYDSAPQTGQVGAPPTLDSLASYRPRLFRTIAAAPTAPWPYGGRHYRRRW